MLITTTLHAIPGASTFIFQLSLSKVLNHRRHEIFHPFNCCMNKKIEKMFHNKERKKRAFRVDCGWSGRELWPHNWRRKGHEIVTRWRKKIICWREKSGIIPWAWLVMSFKASTHEETQSCDGLKLLWTHELAGYSSSPHFALQREYSEWKLSIVHVLLRTLSFTCN